MYQFASFKDRLVEIEHWIEKEFATIRTGRATPAFLDGILVTAYGTKQPIKHVANISIEDPKTLRIAPWDKSVVKDVESGLRASNIGLSIAVDDNGIRVNFPELTEESRRAIIKIAREKLEEARISVRKERERVISDIDAKEKAGEISEDEKFRAKDEVQKIVDSANQTLEKYFDKKESEIMTI